VALLSNIRRDAAALIHLLARVNGHGIYEDGFYRFYHQSFKVFGLQESTAEIAAALLRVAPGGQPFCKFFDAILAAGLGRAFGPEDNDRWVERAAPVVRAIRELHLAAEVFTGMMFRHEGKGL
jgi:hypothetical protein